MYEDKEPKNPFDDFPERQIETFEASEYDISFEHYNSFEVGSWRISHEEDIKRAYRCMELVERIIWDMKDLQAPMVLWDVISDLKKESENNSLSETVKTEGLDE